MTPKETKALKLGFQFCQRQGRGKGIIANVDRTDGIDAFDEVNFVRTKEDGFIVLFAGNLKDLCGVNSWTGRVRRIWF